MSIESAQSKRSPGLRPQRRWLWLVLGPALAFGAGLSVSAARAQEMAVGLGMVDGGGQGGFFAHRLERMLDKVNATAGQRSQIEAIWNGLRPQLRSLHEQHATVRKQMVAALTAATIDPAAVEQLRQQSMTLADKTSTVFTQGVVQSAQLLTPDQRKLAQQDLAEARGRFHRHGAGQP